MVKARIDDVIADAWTSFAEHPEVRRRAKKERDKIAADQTKEEAEKKGK